MNIVYHRRFEKSFQKLTKKLQNKVISVIDQFQANPLAPSLRNHSLKGELEGKRAISVTGNIRIIFEEQDHYTMVLMLDLGTHNQVY